MKTYLRAIPVIAAVLLASCMGEPPYGPQSPDGWNHMMYYGFGYGGMFMWIIFLIVIGLLVYFIVQARKPKGQTPTQNETCLDILKKRYAKGEITKEEYEGMRKDLEV